MSSRRITPAPSACLGWGAGIALLMLLAAAGCPEGGAAPERGLSRLRPGPLSVGYLNAIRSGIGTTTQNIAALNYEAVDLIALAFTRLNADGTLDLTYGNFDLYETVLLPNAHARGVAVLMSVVGEFAAVTANATLRQTTARHLADAIETHGFDGVDFDWEWPKTAIERDNFTAFMEEVYTTVKARHTDYIVMFVQGPGYWLAATDWAAVRDYSDFCFCIAYDWKNPANGPIRNPGSVQWLGLNGGTIEAAAKGAVDYLMDHGYPSTKTVVGLPFYSSDNRSWFRGRDLWAADRLGYLAAGDPDYREVYIDGAWWTSPDNLKQKMDALLDPRVTVLSGGRTARGIGFWELGHEDLANPELTDAIRAWRAGDRSLGGIELPLPAHTQTLVNQGSLWRYLDTGMSPGGFWIHRIFDDRTWPRGLAPLGYGDGDEATVVRYGPSVVNKHITTYFRHEFVAGDPSLIRALTLRLLRDDGAAVYLNGTEIFRSNLPTGPVSSTTLAAMPVSGPEERTWFHTVAVDPQRLVGGTNLLAVEVHQYAPNSSDLSFDLQLLAETDPARVVVVPARSRWQYVDASTAPGADWTAVEFNDQAWFEGPGRLGYGLDGEHTPLLYGANPDAKPITCYFRHSFLVDDPAVFGPVHLDVQFDDGAAVYLNGSEIFRGNLPAGTLTPSTRALETASGAAETDWIRAAVGADLLVAGTNTIAAEVHQVSPTSSDLGFDLQLSAALRPSLTIWRTPTNLLLRWPATAPGFRLQGATVLAGNFDWTTLAITGRVSGGYFEAPVTLTGQQFFRLRAP